MKPLTNRPVGKANILSNKANSVTPLQNGGANSVKPLSNKKVGSVGNIQSATKSSAVAPKAKGQFKRFIGQ